MERRKFLKSTAIVSAPLLFNKIPVMASSEIESSSLNALAAAAAKCGKILVIVQMNGGNDGLNTVFPKDKWGELTSARGNILMNEKDVLSLNGNVTTGLHPAMSAMQSLYNNGKMMIVQGVSYPNPSYSHFRATDIWFTASDSNTSLTTGWLGRALDTIYPNFPTAYPNPEMPDPLAIQIGSTLPFSLQGPKINMAYSVPKPEDLLNVINATSDPAPNNDYGLELSFLRLMKDQSNIYRAAIQNAYNVAQPKSATYPSQNSLANQLKIVAKLINGGLQTPIYIVNHPESHDTHENQVLDTDKKLGKQAKNLKILSDAIGAFQADLKIIGKDKLVTGMTFSEFGRRLKSNDSMGTDHGTIAPIIFFGAALNTGKRNVEETDHPISGMIGKSPDLPQNADVNDEIPMQFDYRQVYSSIMQDWLCMTQAQATAVLGGTFEKLPIFKNGLFQTGTFYDDAFISIFPNPVTSSQINIQFNDFFTATVNIIIYSIQGTKIFGNAYDVDGDILSFNTNTYLATGTYVLELEYNGTKFRKKMLVM
jgi:uncharacterized protein (DUF1501 family)